MTCRPVPSVLVSAALLALVACSGSGAPDAARSACGSEPALQASRDEVVAAMGMPDSPGDGTHDPVLLVHGTGSTSEESWASTYVPALSARGFEVYTVDLPGKAYVDIQQSSDYLVHAIRFIHERTRRRVDVIGHSQGGLEPRWALKWWPDLRAQVDDLITLATPHHGTVIVDAYCAGGCKPAHWQMAPAARFIAALNAGGETFAGVDVTSLYSRNDELVQPQLPVSTAAVEGAADIAVQDLCPGRPVDHVGMMRDGAVFALVLDALEHDGAAQLARVDPLACADLLIPGIGPVNSLQGNYYFFASGNSDVADVTAEPPLAAYVCD